MQAVGINHARKIDVVVEGVQATHDSRVILFARFVNCVAVGVLRLVGTREQEARFARLREIGCPLRGSLECGHVVLVEFREEQHVLPKRLARPLDSLLNKSGRDTLVAVIRVDHQVVQVDGLYGNALEPDFARVRRTDADDAACIQVACGDFRDKDGLLAALCEQFIGALVRAVMDIDVNPTAFRFRALEFEILFVVARFHRAHDPIEVFRNSWGFDGRP